MQYTITFDKGGVPKSIKRNAYGLATAIERVHQDGGVIVSVEQVVTDSSGGVGRVGEETL